MQSQQLSLWDFSVEMHINVGCKKIAQDKMTLKNRAQRLREPFSRPSLSHLGGQV
jgi:hypothetical protein